MFSSSVTSYHPSGMDFLTWNIAFKKDNQKLAYIKCGKWQHRRCYPCKQHFTLFRFDDSDVIFSLLSKSYTF